VKVAEPSESQRRTSQRRPSLSRVPTLTSKAQRRTPRSKAQRRTPRAAVKESCFPRTSGMNWSRNGTRFRRGSLMSHEGRWRRRTPWSRI
jgi:hypothetical protein